MKRRTRRIDFEVSGSMMTVCVTSNETTTACGHKRDLSVAHDRAVITELPAAEVT